jgi:hypothetical protein
MTDQEFEKIKIIDEKIKLLVEYFEEEEKYKEFDHYN